MILCALFLSFTYFILVSLASAFPLILLPLLLLRPLLLLLLPVPLRPPPLSLPTNRVFQFHRLRRNQNHPSSSASVPPLVFFGTTA